MPDQFALKLQTGVALTPEDLRVLQTLAQHPRRFPARQDIVLEGSESSSLPLITEG